MATESQLRELLLTLEQGAPAVGDVLDTLRPGRVRQPTDTRRRVLLAGAAVAVVLVAVVVVSAVLGVDISRRTATHPATGPAAAPARQQLLPSWQFTIAKVPGYETFRRGIIRVGPVTWVQQEADVVATSGHVTGGFILQVGSPGGYQDQLAQQQQLSHGSGRTVTINGRSGYFTPGTPVTGTGLDPTTYRDDPWAVAESANDNKPLLIWQLPNNTWGMLQGTFGFQRASYSYDNATAMSTMTRLARAVQYVAHQPVTMPFRLVGVPAALAPESIRAYTRPDAQCLGYGTGAGPYPTGSVGSVVTVCREDTQHAPKPAGKIESLLESGKTLATRTLEDGTTLIMLASPAHSDGVSLSEAHRLLDDADVAPSFDKPSTWLPVT